MNHGFIRVAAAIPPVLVADCRFNVKMMFEQMEQAAAQQVAVICFPELSVSSYSCADLFFQEQLLQDAEKALNKLLLRSFSIDIVAIVGMPLRVENQLFNTAVVIQSGRILGVVPKTHLPNNNEFYEKRWFAGAAAAKTDTATLCGSEVPFGTALLFGTDFRFGIEICEDLWVPVPPGTAHCRAGADIIFNLSASNELIGKHAYLRQLIEQQSARCNSAYVYASAGFGESSTDLVYAGNAIIAENGKIVAASERFSFESQLIISEVDIEMLRHERLKNSNYYQGDNGNTYRRIAFDTNEVIYETLQRSIARHPFVPSESNKQAHCEEIFSIQVGGLAKRWKHTGAETMVIGISGGLDSTLALLVAVFTADKLGFDRRRVVGITMPGFGTTDRTYRNAVQLMTSLGITQHEISIVAASEQHFRDIGHDSSVHDVTYENTQARERTQILMDMANKTNGLVVGTGDLSELALGWATYNGDHMSMYGVNSGVPKTLVRYLVSWAANNFDTATRQILEDVLNTPVSPELLPLDDTGNMAQKTEHLIGPYELHDFYLYYMVRFGFTPAKILYLAQLAFGDDYDSDTLSKWLKVFLKRFQSQQFKRSCMPDGPKVGSINLSPRGDWRMPSDAAMPLSDEI